MKDLISKIKTLDYKQFALQHGEKIGLGVVGLIALVCLGMTNWSSAYTLGTPEDMVKRAEDVEKKLRNNPWPDELKKDFLPFVDAQAELDRVVAEVDKKRFVWDVDMSKKLYRTQEPAGEPDWVPPSDLIALTGKMPLAVAALQSSGEAAADEPETKKPAKGKKGSKKGNDADDLLKGPAGMGPGGAGGGGFTGASSEKARGVRFNVVLGIVNVQQQYQKLRTALHLDFVHQAKSHLEYSNFKIQRQRAVPGPNPWTGPWKDVSVDSSVEILNEASDYDPEPIDLKYKNQLFTSPLPHRLDVDWDPKLIVHHKIPTLSEEDLDKQDQEVRDAAEKRQAEGDDDSGQGRRRGFSGIQKDGAKIKEMGRDSGMGGGGMGGGGGRGPAPNGRMGPGPGGRMGGPGGAMGNTNSSNGPGPVAGDASADLLLFRYFDFDVEPGECYRYRVQLVVDNPSYDQQFVANPDVAAGEFRETPWSSPSTAVAVEKDVDYALAKAMSKGGVITGAELNVVQFDPNTGTLISDILKVPYGAYVGAEKKKTLHLELAPPKLEEDEVTFSSKDVLLDSAAAPALSATAVADLKISPKTSRELQRNGALDLAVTVDRFGEIVDLDGGSKQDIELALKKVEEERKDYKDLSEETKKKKKDAKAAEDDGNRRPGRRGRRGKNPLKSPAGPSMGPMGGAGGAGGFGPAPMPGAGPTGKAKR